MLKSLKYLGFIPLLISSVICSGQGVRFQFYRTKACSTIEQLDSTYSLYQSFGDLETRFYPRGGIVYLPDTGEYRIYTGGPIFDTVFNIRDTDLFVFRFKEPAYGRYPTGATDSPPAYFCCDSLMNGYQEFHYDNGNLEMRGTFKQGYPKDSIVTFYPNGQTRKRVMRYPKVIIITEFDSFGHKLSVYHNQNKSFMTYWEFHHKEFYPDGKIKRKESSVKQIKRITEFYPNGQVALKQTKRYRTEYFDNGLKRTTYTWTYKRDHIMRSKDFTVFKTDYDSTGVVKRKTIYEMWNCSIAQPSLSLNRSDWVVSVDRYEGGNKVFSAQDMDTKDFMNKYPDKLGDSQKGGN